MEQISIVNQTPELGRCLDWWTYNEQYHCWCLEHVLYTQKAVLPECQQLSIFVPRDYLNPDGTVREDGKSGRYTAGTAPVVFENSSGGYGQMPPFGPDSHRFGAGQYLERGLVYVTCGCRGRESRDRQGKPVGKAPASLVDFKTAIRFLRHNRGVLPGDFDRIISVGVSSGGAMSSLLAVTGDCAAFEPDLKENGAFLEESDAVFAAQIYCPIIDLEHADLAYEWMFHADKESEDSHAGPAETMTPFKEALSSVLSGRYIAYFNSLGLRDPATGEALTLNPDGRSGTAYDYLMARLEDSATDYLTRLAGGRLPRDYTVQDYLSGSYTYEAMTRPGGVPERRQGSDKRDWLTWDGARAHISGLDDYVLRYRGRMKPCTAFDKLDMDSGENQVFGNAGADYAHFSPDVARALDAVREQFPEEYERYRGGFAGIEADQEIARRVRMLNPLSYIRSGEKAHPASRYRIRVGSQDADTALSISMTLALLLANAGWGSVDYAVVWDQPHCGADYPGELCDWIEEICPVG